MGDTPASGDWPSPRVVYQRRYNIGFFGLERLHPFDSRKYGRAWEYLRRRFGPRLDRLRITPDRPATQTELLRVHAADYLDRLRDPAFVARALELPQLRLAPGQLVDLMVLRPMRWATRGTVLAAEAALEHGLAVNLGGGYHHARPDHGHGFCAYADVALAIHELRGTGKLAADDAVAYVDLDAHQGDGVCHAFADDGRVAIYDQYNSQIFPRDPAARRRVDCDVPMTIGWGDADYLSALRERLPTFINDAGGTGRIGLAVYNAGTDVFAGDQLGGLNVSAAGVLERDRFVLGQFIQRRIPTLVVLSGGYSRQSYLLVAEMVAHAVETWAP